MIGFRQIGRAISRSGHPYIWPSRCAVLRQNITDSEPVGVDRSISLFSQGDNREVIIELVLLREFEDTLDNVLDQRVNWLCPMLAD